MPALFPASAICEVASLEQSVFDRGEKNRPYAVIVGHFRSRFPKKQQSTRKMDSTDNEQLLPDDLEGITWIDAAVLADAAHIVQVQVDELRDPKLSADDRSLYEKDLTKVLHEFKEVCRENGF